MKSSDKNKSRPNDSIGIGVAGSTATMHVTSMSGKKSPIPKKNIPVTDAKQQRRSFDNPIEGLITQQKKFFTSEINGDATSPSKQKNKLSRDPSMSTQGIELDNVELLELYHHPQSAEQDTMGKAINIEMRSERSAAVERAAQHDSVKELIIQQLEDLEKEKSAKRTPAFLSQFAVDSEKKRRSPFVNADITTQTATQGQGINGLAAGTSAAQMAQPTHSSSSPILVGQTSTATGAGAPSMESSAAAGKASRSVDGASELDRSIDDSSDGTATAVYMSGQVQYSKSNTMSSQGPTGSSGGASAAPSGQGMFVEGSNVAPFALPLSSMSDRELQMSFWQMQEQFKMEIERRNLMGASGSGGLAGSPVVPTGSGDHNTSGKRVVRRGSKNGEPLSANSGAGYPSPTAVKKPNMGSQQEQRNSSRPSSRVGGAFMGASSSSKNQGLSSSRDFQVNANSGKDSIYPSCASPQLGEEPEDREVESAFASLTLESYHARVSTPNNHLRVVSRGSGAVPPNEKMFLNSELYDLGKDPPSRPPSTHHSRPSSSRPHSSKSNNQPSSRPPSTMSGSSLSPIPPGRMHSESPLVGKDSTEQSRPHARRSSRGNTTMEGNGRSASTGGTSSRDKMKKKIRAGEQRSSTSGVPTSSTSPDSFLLDRIGSSDSGDPESSGHYFASLESDYYSSAPYHTGVNDWSSICRGPGHKTVAVKVINPIISRRNRESSLKQPSNSGHRDGDNHCASSNSSDATADGLNDIPGTGATLKTSLSMGSVTGSTAGSGSGSGSEDLDIDAVAGAGGLDNLLMKGFNNRSELVQSPFSAFDDVSVGSQSNKSFNSSRSGFSTISSNRKKDSKHSTGGASPHRRSARSQSSTVSVSQNGASLRVSASHQ